MAAIRFHCTAGSATKTNHCRMACATSEAWVSEGAQPLFSGHGMMIETVSSPIVRSRRADIPNATQAKLTTAMTVFSIA